MSKNIKPLGDRLLVKRSQAEKTKGGIILPDNAKEKPKHGQVVAVGPGNLTKEGVLVPLDIKVGDNILFSSYAGNEVKSDDGEEYLIMSAEDVFGVLV